jgi:hypothetical protein
VTAAEPRGLRAAIAVGLFSSGVLILLMALLAGSAGLRVNGSS